MSFLDDFLGVVGEAICAVVDFIVDVIVGICDFFADVVDWFKRLGLQKGRDIAFVANPKKLRDLLHQAPVTHVPGLYDDTTVLEGVYNEYSDEVTDLRVLKSDGLDSRTRSALEEGLTVLS